MKKWILFPLFLLCFSASSANTIAKVIDVKHVDAKLLQQTLLPILKKGDSISVFENKLVVNVSPETLTQIRAIIHELDKPKPVLLVSIHQGSDNWLNDGYQPADIYSTSSNHAVKDNQSIQILNGTKAFVSTGRNFPVLQQAGTDLFLGVSYQRMISDKGFFISPVLEGNKIRLTIQRFYDEQSMTDAQSVKQSGFKTTTIIPLNQWVKLSETSASSPTNNNNAYSFHAGEKFEQQGSLYIKIQLIRNNHSRTK
ncbi:hypothetical protein FOG18_13200 [Legionella israelensis]|uniref:secretin N-terminal domain-containing protein n=1 Tax=Legionella israelensis TaxID=454 RepID=UPI00117D7BE1|nr:secretin N-terminal domain-containing protein [Legionella israelensis]QDP73451.1 hypothetical protein FOG18_13200 [Legionella israelensis]